MKVAVIGGGISGIRAALTLARGGCRVTLFEKSSRLGGRASFDTPDFGEIDIGQHIWLRACVGLEELLRDLDVPDDWVYRQDRVAMPYRWPDGTHYHFAAGRLPGALAALPALLRAPKLRFGEKLRYLWGMIRTRLYRARSIEALDGLSFADWLKQQRQPQAVIDWFWKPFIVGVCNGRIEEVSARHALFMVRVTLLHSAEASAICLLRQPLSAVFDSLAHEVLTNAGVDVRWGAMVSRIVPGAPVQVHCGSQAEDFDRVVMALPLRYLRTLLPGVTFPETPEEGAIAGLLLKFARPVMEEMFFTAVGSPVQHVFNKTAIWQQTPADGSQLVELVLSAAEREVKLGVEQLSAELLPALGQLLPAVRDTPVLARRMLVHARATFRVTPGGEPRRLPIIRPDVANVVFAGDYAATGLPSTMESAALAGQAAARVILRDPGATG